MSVGFDSERERRDNYFYERGVIDAWNAGRLVVNSVDEGGLTFEQLRELFPDANGYGPSGIFKLSSPINTVKKLLGYKENLRKCYLGEEVEIVNNQYKHVYGVVIKIDNSDTHFPYLVLLKSGIADWISEGDIAVKTGRVHVSIKNTLDNLPDVKEDEK